MNGDIVFSIRVNSKTQYHIDELLKINPKLSRNKVICQALENIDIDTEKTIKKLKGQIEILQMDYDHVHEQLVNMIRRNLK
jgi:hypothetical protein|tara:strand:- start:214 stop:456 length:243 start_codon:yes stop_codon:yes gene_type:complete